jgi:hypothetical protein
MRMLFSKRAIIVTLVLIIASNHSKSQTSFIWGKQFGTDKEEYALNHVIDNYGNVYVAGKTTGIMEGKNRGMNDGFITKIDSLGNTVWSKQFGTSGEEDIQWSAIDNTGCIYITGSTTGILSEKNFGKEDIFIVKYKPDGEMEWCRQFGSDSTDVAKGIYADNKGYVYLTGMTAGKLGQSSFGKADGFVMKLDNKGSPLFITQFGTSGDDYSYAITGGANSDIFICGSTWGDLGAKNKGLIDGFTGKLTDNGKVEGYTQFGSEGFDIAMNLKVDDKNNIYVGGTTSGNFGCQQLGDGDCFLIKMGPEGGILWNNQFGTKNNDGTRAIAFNPEIPDIIIVSGILCLPPGKAFIRVYKKDGTLLWEQNFAALGKNGGTSGKDVTLDNRGNFYHMGLTGANLFDTLSGEHDVYLVKYRLEKNLLKH